MVFEEDCLYMIWLQVDDNRENTLKRTTVLILRDTGYAHKPLQPSNAPF
jgi:hypothetical protein